MRYFRKSLTYLIKKKIIQLILTLTCIYIAILKPYKKVNVQYTYFKGILHTFCLIQKKRIQKN